MKTATVKKEFRYAVDGVNPTTFAVGEQELPDDAYAYAERKGLLGKTEDKARKPEENKGRKE
jgi:hypothetical protein